MNERIKDLATEAEFSEKDLHIQGDNFQRFAELIVEEMYDFMCKATENDGAWPSSKEVKQHFGVEE